MSNINSLCLSGGSIRGFQLLGALAFVNEYTSLKDMTYLLGTSAGAMICYLLCLGYAPMEIMTSLTSSKVWDKFRTPNIMACVRGEGVYAYGPINEFLGKLTIEKIGILPTFKKLFTITGRNLRMVTFNFTENKAEILSKDTTPDLPCLVGIHMSCNVPLVFEPFKYNGNMYIDGCIDNHFPINIGIDDVEDKKIIAIAAQQSHPTSVDKNNEFSIINYALSCMHIGINANYRRNVELAESLQNVSFIHLPTVSSGVQSFDYTIDATKKLDMFSSGYKAAKEQFK